MNLRIKCANILVIGFDCHDAAGCPRGKLSRDIILVGSAPCTEGGCPQNHGRLPLTALVEDNLRRSVVDEMPGEICAGPQLDARGVGLSSSNLNLDGQASHQAPLGRQHGGEDGEELHFRKKISSETCKLGQAGSHVGFCTQEEGFGALTLRLMPCDGQGRYSTSYTSENMTSC